MRISFYKYQGTGNDFVMVDDRDGKFPVWDTALVAFICQRRFGIGADGLILLQHSERADFYMKYYNSDGRESSMCGNGGRCIAAFARFLGIAGTDMKFEAVDGPHEAHVDGKYVKLRMKDVSLVEHAGGNNFVVNTGSPHYVSFSPVNLDKMDIVSEARSIRYNDRYAAEGINVNFVCPQADDSLRIRTYERGVEDETYSCGTGVTASALTFAIHKQMGAGPHEIRLQTQGGELSVRFHYEPSIGRFTDVWLQGNAVQVYDGEIDSAVQK
jgi:diaminopimelate epimerase